MRKFGLLMFLLLVCSLAIACANRIPASALAPRVQYQGFSAARPPNDSWYIDRSEQDHTTLLFRRNVLGASHSFFFTVTITALEREPDSDDDFVELARQYSMATNNPERFDVRSYQARPTSRQGQFCVRYSQLTIDHKSPVLPDMELNMSFEGIACRHPLWPNAILDAYYSERARAEELDPSLYPEGEQLLRGIIIEVEPGVPAV